MKNYLKTAINVLASLLVITVGVMPAAQADEVGLDFSVPEADVVLSSPAVKSTLETAPKAFNAQLPTLTNQSPVIGEPRPPTLSQNAIAKTTQANQRSLNATENTAKLIALDFSIPREKSSPAPVVAEFPTRTAPNTLELTSPPANPVKPAKPEVLPPPKPLIAPPISTVKPPAVTARSAKSTKRQVTALRRAIIGQESAGNFWLVNPDSGALGYGQLLRANVAPWTKAALGRALTPEEFLRNPNAQIKTIDHKLNEYLKRELAYTDGNEQLAIRRVASTWYSGNPSLWNNTRPQYSNGRRYPSIASYTGSVWKRYLREIN